MDKGGQLSLRELEKSDSAFVLYLKTKQFEVYSRLFEAQYGKKPKAPAKPTAPAANPASGQQAKVKLAALGPDVTLRQLEKSDPALVLALRQHAPDDYQRLFASQYGASPTDVTAPAGGVINLLLALLRRALPVRDKAPVHVNMVRALEADVEEQLPKLGELANNPALSVWANYRPRLW
ncbi:MAG: hypothetical protein WKG07_01945 [Hymenobacter sp.]